METEQNDKIGRLSPANAYRIQTIVQQVLRKFLYSFLPRFMRLIAASAARFRRVTMSENKAKGNYETAISLNLTVWLCNPA